MSDPLTQTRFVNPWTLHLQKLGLELKCPFCLDLYKKPKLLPCNHIFCSTCVPKPDIFGSECPLCNLPFVDQDLREAPYMENVVNIYRSLDASFTMHMLNSDVGRGMVFPAKEDLHDQMVKGAIDSSSPRNSTSGTTSNLMGVKRLQVANDSLATRKLEKCSQMKHHGGLDVEMNQMVFSPDSPPSSGASKGADIDSREPRGSGNAAEKYPLEKSVKRVADDFGTQAVDEHHDSYVKKQKLSNQGPPPVHNLQNSASSGSGMAKYGSTSGNQLFICAFCQTSKITEGSGPMQHFASGGKQVFDYEAGRSNVVHVHRNCIEWAPQIYFEDDTLLKNLNKEIARAGKLKCTSCGLKGAALGCLAKSCRRSYHVPCAYEIVDCRWDIKDFVMFCPAHSSYKFPSEKVKKSAAKTPAPPHNYDEPKELGESDFWATSSTGSKNWVLCGSALSGDEKLMLVKFAKLCGATVTKAWSPDVTHVIAATDARGACSRTLKVLMAILEGRWILSVDWVKACMDSKCPVDEESYEISLDNHGCCGAPKTGRLRALNNAPMLFTGLRFFFNSNFAPTYKRDLQELILAAGGTILDSREQLQQSHDQLPCPSTTLVIYNDDAATGTGEICDVIQRQVEAEMVAGESGSHAIAHTWLLDSIASCKLQPFVHK